MNRRVLAVLLVLVMAGVFAACKKRVEPLPPPPPPTEAGERGPAGQQVETPAMQPLQETQVSEISDDIDQINRSGLLKKIYFDFDKSDLRPDAIATLDANAAQLKKYPTLRIRLEGHCDERGTEEYNIGLGDRRAKAAYNYLVNMGISPSRMETVSYGKSQPEDPGHNEEAWAKNRRDVFLVIGK
ncbi:MAG: peptidoglycan-associated lipoprotein Pal [Acidobacteriota bacterium]